jgi:hypothetical protein
MKYLKPIFESLSIKDYLDEINIKTGVFDMIEEEINELLLDFKDEGIRCDVFQTSYSEPGFQIYINLDINLYNYVKEGEDKSQSFNEYSDKMTLVLNNMKEFFKRLQDIDFNILLCEFISGTSNDYFMIKIKKIL